jgi:hypothetical protein
MALAQWRRGGKTMRTTTTALGSILALGLGLGGCAMEVTGEEGELPEILDDGKADSASRPTSYGRLFNGVWQYGQLKPDAKVRNPSWRFELEGDGEVTLTMHGAPEAEPDLETGIIYLYRQHGTTWKRVAKTPASGDFPTLSETLEAGSYRMIVKGKTTRAAGRFLVRMDCEGAGCPIGECLFGDRFADLIGAERGAVVNGWHNEIDSSISLTEAQEQQTIAAVHAMVGTSPEDFGEACTDTDDGKFQRYGLHDQLNGRHFVVYEFLAGEEKVGAVFATDEATPLATLEAGYFHGCKVGARTCLFGPEYGMAPYMPGMTLVKTIEVPDGSQIPSNKIEKQMLIAADTDEENLFSFVDPRGFTIQILEAADGRTFTSIEYGSDGLSAGSIFVGDTTTKVADINGGDIVDCVAQY